MLQPVLLFVATAKDATSITLKDGTGSYNVSTNPGGYGTPNPDAPAIVGLRARWWKDTDIYGSLLSDSASILSGLQGDGYAFTTESFGLPEGAFQTGVHHFTYYPFETVDTVVTLTQGSKVVTVTAGTTVDTWNVAYKAIAALNGGNPTGKVYLIDRTQPISSATFYLTEAWAGSSQSGVSIVRSTEADLKVLIYQNAQKCLVAKIGKMALDSCSCDPKTSESLVRMTMFIFSAQADFECNDYEGAHNKLVAVDIECNDCKTQPCSTCS
jgi:hypothetical protein